MLLFTCYKLVMNRKTHGILVPAAYQNGWGVLVVFVLRCHLLALQMV